LMLTRECDLLLEVCLCPCFSFYDDIYMCYYIYIYYMYMYMYMWIDRPRVYIPLLYNLL
jgi:hypothetical protein